jgi:predicted nucleic acid-binding protein
MPMPDLSTLPSESVVFVDTNIFDLQYRGKSVSCDVFIRRIARGEVTAYVNTQVLSDLLHKLMLAEACAKGLIPIRSAQRLKGCLQANRILAGRLADYQLQFENTLSIGLKVLRITKQLLVDTKLERGNHGLLTGDSIHLGNMNRHNQPIRDMVTYDGDFVHVPGLTVWEPMDVVP